MKKEKDVIFSFERGWFFGGSLKYTIFELEDALLFESYSYNDFCYMPDYQFCMPKTAIAEIEKVLRKTILWRRHYRCYYEIDDGYGWDIYYRFKGLKINKRGYMAYPLNYKAVIKALQEEIEKLCEKYADNYSIEGLDERLEL